MVQTAGIDPSIVALDPGETPLWSHIYPAPSKSKLLPRTQKYMSRFFQLLPLIWCVYFGLKTWNSRETIDFGKIATMLLPLIALLILFKIAQALKWRPWPDPTSGELYRNGAITDRRIILYNHDRSDPIIISKQDVKRGEIDYESGGLALKIYRRSAPSPAILTGTADFKEALKIINQEYLAS